MRYRLDRTYAKSKTWRCTKNGYKARYRTDLEHSNVQFTNEHCDHETQSDRDMTVKEFRRNCKRRGADDLFKKPSKIMRQELQNINAHLETGTQKESERQCTMSGGNNF